MFRNIIKRLFHRTPALTGLAAYKHKPVLDARGIDVALCRFVAGYIEENPENYNQGAWFESAATKDDNLVAHFGVGPQHILATKHLTGPECGTKACVSGTGVIASGRFGEFVEFQDGYVHVGMDAPGADSDGEVYRTDIPVIDWPRAGREVFGFDTYTSEWLFSGARIEGAMPAMLREIARGGDVVTMQRIEQAYVLAMDEEAEAAEAAAN